MVKLKGGKDIQAVSLEAKDFKTIDDESLSFWENVDLLSIRAYYEKNENLWGSKSWAGLQPIFRPLRWQGKEP
ncbi:hypothetical protein BH11PLA2_BH11PLA2_43220 [soil metagenome]